MSDDISTSSVRFFPLVGPCSPLEPTVDIIHIHLAWWAELSYSSWALGAIRIYILLGLEPSGIYSTAHEAPWICIYICAYNLIISSVSGRDMTRDYVNSPMGHLTLPQFFMVGGFVTSGL